MYFVQLRIATTLFIFFTVKRHDTAISHINCPHVQGQAIDLNQQQASLLLIVCLLR